MDSFGIGSAILGMVNVYFRGSRQTGRTVQMVESVSDGDRIIFSNSKEAERVRRMLAERNKNVECVVVSHLDRFDLLHTLGTSQGRTVFDHGWVEGFYRQEIEQRIKEIDHWQHQLSGFGEAHLETRRKVEEMRKWAI